MNNGASFWKISVHIRSVGNRDRCNSRGVMSRTKSCFGYGRYPDVSENGGG